MRYLCITELNDGFCEGMTDRSESGPTLPESLIPGLKKESDSRLWVFLFDFISKIE